MDGKTDDHNVVYSTYARDLMYSNLIENFLFILEIHSLYIYVNWYNIQTNKIYLNQ